MIIVKFFLGQMHSPYLYLSGQHINFILERDVNQAVKNHGCEKSQSSSWKLAISKGRKGQFPALPKPCLPLSLATVMALSTALLHHASTILFRDTSLTKLQLCWYLGWYHHDIFLEWVWVPSPYLLILLEVLATKSMLYGGPIVCNKAWNSWTPSGLTCVTTLFLINTVISIGMHQFRYQCVAKFT